MFYLKWLYLGEIKPKSKVVVSVPSGFDLRQQQKLGIEILTGLSL